MTYFVQTVLHATEDWTKYYNIGERAWAGMATESLATVQRDAAEILTDVMLCDILLW